MLGMHEMDAESADLLPGREALGRLKFNFVKTTNVTKHVAYVQAQNNSFAVNACSPEAIAQSAGTQTINIAQ
ncbi:hypothetical protein ACFRAI_37030 [Streptomyces sp. NPDC056637]|uniref:hypothetical protein n=1 Tax=unclassified Streptomyces TaxID=2593676 RepID=UPI00363EF41C